VLSEADSDPAEHWVGAQFSEAYVAEDARIPLQEAKTKKTQQKSVAARDEEPEETRQDR
jgi:hypothetical protein